MDTPLQSKNFERILIIKPSALGDVVHTIPVLVKLRKRYPEAQIDWMLTPENAELVRCHRALSNVVLFERRKLARFARNWNATADLFRLLGGLKRTRYDLVIDLHGQARSALFAFATRAPTRIGFPRPSSFVAATKKALRRGWAGAREGAWMAYTDYLPLPTLDAHAVDRYLWLGKLLAFDDDPPDFHIPLPPGANEKVEAILRDAGIAEKPIAMLVPGTMWETKHWRIEGFAAVARHLAKDFTVILSGAARDSERCETIRSQCPEAHDLSGKTNIAELAALLARAAICVTNDSGAMHLADALGIRTVSIFGPTDPIRVGPYSQPKSVVRAGLECSPCNLRRLSQCPFDHACMKLVSSDDVIARVEAVLRPNLSPASD